MRDELRGLLSNGAIAGGGGIRVRKLRRCLSQRGIAGERRDGVRQTCAREGGGALRSDGRGRIAELRAKRDGGASGNQRAAAVDGSSAATAQAEYVKLDGPRIGRADAIDERERVRDAAAVDQLPSVAA